jgi:transcriptional regulator with XRE-family HTH domain
MMKVMSPLKKRRLLKGLTQLEVSQKSGIPQSRLSLIENNWVTPKEWEKKEITRVLQVEKESIFEEKEE